MSAPQERALYVKRKSQGEKSWKIEVDEGGKFLKSYYCKSEVAAQIEPGKTYGCMVAESEPYDTQYGKKTSWWISAVNPWDGSMQKAPQKPPGSPGLQKVEPTQGDGLSPSKDPISGVSLNNRQTALLAASLTMFGRTPQDSTIVTSLADIYIKWLEGR